MEGLKIQTVSLTSAAAANVLRTVLDAGHTHGLGYWGTVSNVRMKKDQVVSFVVTENEPYTRQKTARTIKVTSADVRQAVESMLRDPKACACRGLIKQLLLDDVDGPLSDAIVQVICFQSVIYG
jgi:hypothetical protein